jgi:pimeloyl-ACP methyl ester carboxylesterase
VSIAYQVFGDGPVDLVFVPGFISHVELAWEEPYLARFLRRLAAFSRVIFFDKRGTGLSDPVTRPPGLAERMDDIRAVMDAAGSQAAALFGVSDGGCLCIAFAVARPERSAALVAYGSFARRLRSADYPWAGRLSTSRRCFAGWTGAGPLGSGGLRPIPASPMMSITRHGGLATCVPRPALRWDAARSG